MRVISQDGTIDVPYEYISLVVSIAKCKDVEHVCIYCHNISAPHGTRLAEYSSKAKAIKAMETLREAWINEAIEFTHGIYHRNIVFQFPQDNEIEV